MSIFKALIDILKQDGESRQEMVPEGLCPNCWGRYEYAGKFYEAVKNNKVDINSSNPNVGWIQDYVDKHLSEIKLKRDDDKNMICQKCKVSYRPA